MEFFVSFIILLLYIFTIIFIKGMVKGVFARFFILLFATLWFIDFILAELNIIQVGVISDLALFISLCGTICFIVGFVILQKHQRADTKRSTVLEKLDVKISRLCSSNTFFLAYSIALIVVVYQILIVLPKLMLAGNLSGGMRVEAMTGELYSPLFYLAKDFILAPMYAIAITIMPYKFIRGGQFWKCLPMFLYVIAFPMLTGGRMGYAIILLMFVAVYGWFLNSKQLIRKKIKQVAIISVVIVAALFSLMTVVKRGDVTDIKESLEFQKEDESLFKEAVLYFVGPIKAFEYAINHDYERRLGGWQEGRATFAAVDHYVNPILNIINHTKEPNENSRIGKIIQDQWIPLGNGSVYWNALYTSNLYFYLDFGILGCLLFPFLFGCLTSIILNKVEVSGKLSHFFLLFYIVRMCLTSMLSFYPVEGDVLPFLFMLLAIYLIESSRFYVRKNSFA